jgi:HEAT repeat protein
MNNQVDLQDLILDLNHLDKSKKEEAYDVLIGMGVGVVPALVEDFELIAGPARLLVIRAFGEIGDTRAVPLLLALMQTDDPEEYLYVASFAAKSLGQIGGDVAIAGLLSALNHERPGPRRMAATVLGNLGDLSAVSALVVSLGDPDRQTQVIAAKALRKLGTDDAIKAVDLWEQTQ